VATKHILIRLLILCPGFAQPDSDPPLHTTHDDLEFSFGSAYASTFLVTSLPF
jgi:hypothetical protein